MKIPYTFNEVQINKLFPFYIAINKDLNVVALGKSLHKLCDFQKPQDIHQLFSMVSPSTLINSFDDFIDLQDQTVTVALCSDKKITLKGQFEYIEDSEEILFLGSTLCNAKNQDFNGKPKDDDFAKNDPFSEIANQLQISEAKNAELQKKLTTLEKNKKDVKAKNKEYYDISLFSRQSLDPNIRINFQGDLMLKNPAASHLNFIDYEGKIYDIDAFFKVIAAEIDDKTERWNFEASAHEKIYSFVCIASPSKGYINIYARDITKQKKHQLESEKLSIIVQETMNAVIITDSKGKVEWVNKAYEEISGYSFNEVIGKKPGAFSQGEGTDKETIAYMRQQIKDLKPFTCEVYNYKKTGEGYWLRIKGQPIFDKNGKMSNYFATEEDITKQKTYQQELEKLSLIVQETMNAVIITDAHANIEWVNNAFETISGYKFEEVKGHKPGNFLQGKETDLETVAYMRQQIRAAKPFICEVYNYKKTGEGYWLRIKGQPVFDKSGKLTNFFAIEEDITNVKANQNQIKESEKKYRDLIDNSLAIITTHNLEGKILSSNPMVAKIYGYTELEYVDHYISDFISKEDKLLFKENYLDVFKSNKITSGTLRMLGKEGNIIYTLYNNYLMEEQGKEPYVISSAVDITKRILMEKELIRSKKITEELARSKHNFLANMSHEIRTPMNAIIGMSRQLQKSKLNDEQHNYLNIISTASENLLVIINDILDLSKLEANKLSFEKIVFNLKEVIENALNVMQYKAEEKGIQLRNTYYDTQLSPILIGDPHRLNQILLNVISNAIKFTEVGSVDVSCRVLKDHDTYQDLEIKVTDTGIGMDPSFLKKLFEKFTQEYENKARNYGGTGLGMAITKSLVDNMQGDILVESEIGTGTTISITFALEKGKKVDLKIKNTIVMTSTNLKGKKILVVDDNLMNRMVAKVILKDYEVTIIEASNGEEAVDYLRNDTCDLVLMDIQMPILNGHDASIVIREELKLDIPIIALTANVMKGEKEKCIEFGMNDYLSKPFDEEKFLEIISIWIGKTSSSIV
ncbi:PAS domain S-box protein [Polaribacter litorisediminis]|uniref:PAS domain S-box protein n=1 Tax=Polaribacter litorisediminis TaxID=1908341 RepID=UPI001CC18177|nr:PAS domain S-box protein [Polaribacter litorisediminis]UAM96749.1 PAS domain S-box protein [Polaribacter litorisediminis]